MKLKTFKKVPVEIDLTKDEQYELVGNILREHYHENYEILEEAILIDMDSIHEYFTGKPIDYLER